MLFLPVDVGYVVTSQGAQFTDRSSTGYNSTEFLEVEMILTESPILVVD
jgi:hypothetical protein